MEVILKGRPLIGAACGDRDKVLDKKIRLSCGDDDEDGGGDNIAYKIGSRRSSPDQGGSKPASPSSQKDSALSKEISAAMVNGKVLSPVDANSRSSPSNGKDLGASKKDQLESAKAEMGEVREENERLKMTLARIVKDYQSLQMQFYDIVNQEQLIVAKKSTEGASTDQEMDERDQNMVSLSLGTTTIGPKKEEKGGNIIPSKSKEDEQLKEGLTLGLDCKFEESNSGPADANRSPENSSEVEAKDEDQVGEPWPPSKILKTLRNGEDDLSQQAHAKKARVSVRARCEAPTMNDGCQWRKYGQKIAKGNPCPRAYYRCTVSPGCPVRKQVQRCAEDMSILITTYEGTHNHPLPISATAMASTTSAAASMLMSGSSTSRQTMVLGGAPSISTTSADLHGLNFNLTDSSSSASALRSRPFYLSSPSVVSSSPSYPTITLDLTAPPAASSSNISSPFNRLIFPSSFPSSTTTPRFSSTSFNFSSSSESNTLPLSWGSGTSINTGSSYLSYGSSAQPYNKSSIGTTSFMNQGSTQENTFYQSYLQKNMIMNSTGPAPQQSLTETIAAATKVITSDPNFRSALAAAITSIVGSGSTGVNSNSSISNNIAGDQSSFGLVQNLKWGEQVQAAINMPYSSTPAANGSSSSCAPSYLNRTSSSSNPQQAAGNFMFLPPALPFSSKSASASPVDNRDHIS